MKLLLRAGLAVFASLLLMSAFAQTSPVGIPDLSHAHVFTSFGNIQSSSDQIALVTDIQPLPISISANQMRWTNGPYLANLNSVNVQGVIKLDEKVKFVFNELYQNQGNINLTNNIIGFNVRPNSDWSINLSGGAGTGTLYTFKSSAYISPQYKLPVLNNGKPLLSISADFLMQNYELGKFSQLTPKTNLYINELIPMLSIGYALGNFKYSSNVTQTQYYQPLTQSGVFISPVIRTSERTFTAVSWYPNNLNNIGGVMVRQNTLGGTFNYQLTSQFRMSVFAQYQNISNGSIDVAYGGGINLSF
jgi:hypothetical protein